MKNDDLNSTRFLHHIVVFADYLDPKDPHCLALRRGIQQLVIDAVGQREEKLETAPHVSVVVWQPDNPLCTRTTLQRVCSAEENKIVTVIGIVNFGSIACRYLHDWLPEKVCAMFTTPTSLPNDGNLPPGLSYDDIRARMVQRFVTVLGYMAAA